jgi:pSer/pThr/pTyr-binding forkhead associated (FHA) protein
MSGQHAKVVEREGRYFLVDEQSRNGTFIRIREEIELKPGDTFLVGKQVFKFGTEK